MVDRRAVLAEQLAKLPEGEQVAAVGEGGDSEGTPGSGGHEPAFRWIGDGERPVGMPACVGGVSAQRVDGGRDQVSGSGDEFHLVRLSQASRLGGGFQGLVPASGVDVEPSEGGQARAAGTPRAWRPEPLHSILQQCDRQVRFVQEPRGRPNSP